jgi:hypothetical protein
MSSSASFRGFFNSLLVLGNLTPLKTVTVTPFRKDPKTQKDVKVGEAITLQVAR